MQPQGKWTQQNFEAYHAQNPDIYREFERFALQAARFKKRFSAKAIMHRIRWETMVGGLDDKYKIDDGWISHYARKFMDEHPEHAGIFETRQRRVSYHHG